MIKGRVGERQRAGVTDLEINSRLSIALPRMLDIDGREVDSADLCHTRRPGKLEREVAGAAADVEHMRRVSNFDEGDEGAGESPAPSAHLQLIAVAIGCNECG